MAQPADNHLQGKVEIAHLAMLAGLAGTAAALSTESPWLISGISIAVAGTIYGLVTLLLRSEEPMALIRGIRGRARVQSRDVHNEE